MRPQIRRPAAPVAPTGDTTASSSTTSQPIAQPPVSSMPNAMPTPPGYMRGERHVTLFNDAALLISKQVTGSKTALPTPRFKRTTGIPKSFLKTVDPSTAAVMTNNGTSNSQGVMITPDGSHVIATPDIATWEKARSTKSAALTVNDVRNAEPKHVELKCGLSGRLLNNPVILPCCKTSFSDDHVNQYLIENDFRCPKCHSNVGTLDNLKPNPELKQRIVQYINEELQLDKVKRIEASKEGDGEGDNDSSDMTKKESFEIADKKALFHDDIVRLNKLIHDCQFAIMAIVDTLKKNQLDDKIKIKFQSQLVQINQIMNLHQGQVMMMMNGMDPNVFGMPLLPQLKPSTGQKRQSDDDDYNNARPSKR
ncbi:hypothetical protein E3P99_03940 [Wallemia hederae]|uniref:U-box domain-containing protein n=1 Tax=Wallemia hederae TaxID=1540922 RepID=A0A4V6TM97_9BASI|nr:hypothetical protein E3P99_03940 [Wallemia hederae]